MFWFGYDDKYYINKSIAQDILIPRLEKKIEELRKKDKKKLTDEHKNNLYKQMNEKQIIVTSLKYYYGL